MRGLGRRAAGWLLGLTALLVLSACGELSLPSLPDIPIPGLGEAATPPALKIGDKSLQPGGLPAGFPAGFPLPPQHQVQSGADDGRQLAVVLTVQSAQAAYDFYKGALPGAGYQVRELGGATVGGSFNGGLGVSGNGFGGELAFTAAGSAQLVSIRLERNASGPGQGKPAITPPGPPRGTSVPKPGEKPAIGEKPAADGLPVGFPASFPLPPQYQLQSATDDGRQLVVVLTVQSAQAAYDFYKGALPLSGYQAREEGGATTSGGVFNGTLSVSGNGRSGRLVFTGAGATNLVTIGLGSGGATAPATPKPDGTPATSKPGGAPATPKPGGAPTAVTKPSAGGLPAGFPLPPQAKVTATTDDGQQIGVVLEVVSAKEAMAFYKQALPGAGYQVTERGAVDGPGGAFGGTLEISGNGLAGELAFGGNPAGQTVAMRLERTGAAEKPAEKPAPPGGGQPVGGLPAGFPLPPDHRVQASADNGRQIAVVLNVQSAQAACDFFKQALPGAGYQLTERGTVNSGGSYSSSLNIRGNGVSGDIVCTSSAGNNIVAISLNRT